MPHRTNNLEEISNLRNTFKPLLSLHHKFQDLHSFTHEAVNRNSGNILINSEEIANLKTQFGGKNGSTKFVTAPIHDKVITRLSIIENNLLVKEKDNTENKNFILNKLNNMNAKFEGFPEDIKKLQNEVYYLKARVQELEVKKSPITEENITVAQRSNSEKHLPEKILDCDVLLLFDSNGQHLNPDKFSRQGKCQYEKVITVSSAIDKIKTSRIESAPQKILLNVGLNDVGVAKSHTLGTYEDMLNIIHEKMSLAKIYISSTFKRKDAKFDSEIIELNDHIAKFSEDLKWITYIDHSNINGSVMYNPKHLNKTGFYVMLTNLRYVMFQILRFRKNNHKRGKYPPKRHVPP